VLVIAPTSVVGSWVEQAERFCPGLRVRAVRRTAAKREETLAQIVEGCDVVVTSYTIARLCEEEFIAQDWAWVVCDEAQFVKNHTSATYKAVRRLRSPSTIAITGTPLENSLMDLWALMSIAAPGLLPDPERFGQVYRKPIDRGDAEALGRRLPQDRGRVLAGGLIEPGALVHLSGHHVEQRLVRGQGGDAAGGVLVDERSAVDQRVLDQPGARGALDVVDEADLADAVLRQGGGGSGQGPAGGGLCPPGASGAARPGAVPGRR